MQIPFHKADISNLEKEYVLDSLESGWITMGQKTIKFEENIKKYIGAKYAVSVNSATAALHLALKAIGVGTGDEVIIPTTTFIATAEVVTYMGATPVLCDIEYATHNIDAGKIEALITSRTKAIIPVHFAGQICEMDEINTIAKKYSLRVIEDAAHCLPGTYKGKSVGVLSDITCFSFYATKTLATGEGGMATTENDEWAKSMKINRLHGISRDAWDRYTATGSWYYEVVENGYKYNTTDINAALGLAQLERVHELWFKRKAIADKYSSAFSGKIETIALKNDRETSYHLYVVKVNNRDELYNKLKEKGITPSVHFIPVHFHPYYRERYQYQAENYPIANDVFSKSLSLPIYPSMSTEEVDYVIDNVLAYAK